MIRVSEIEAVRLHPDHPSYTKEFQWATRKGEWPAKYANGTIEGFHPLTEGRIIGTNKSLKNALQYVKTT